MNTHKSRPIERCTYSAVLCSAACTATLLAVPLFVGYACMQDACMKQVQERRHVMCVATPYETCHVMCIATPYERRHVICIGTPCITTCVLRMHSNMCLATPSITHTTGHHRYIKYVPHMGWQRHINIPRALAQERSHTRKRVRVCEKRRH